MSNTVSVPVGVVIIREEIDNPWCDHVWRAMSVTLDVPPGLEWKELTREEGRVQYLAGALVELFRKETAAYLDNISGDKPALYVVLRESDGSAEDEPPIEVHLVTASPYEAQDYMDSSEEFVERVPMPEPLVAMIADYIEQHHVEEKFRKRKRDAVDIEEHKFGQEPIFVLRQRMAQVKSDDD